MSNIITIRKSPNGDSRTMQKDNITIEELREQIDSHILDVRKGMAYFGQCIDLIGLRHDHTKIKYIEEFHDNLLSGKQGEDFKSLGWFEKHITEERHHINDNCPSDVNLLDIIEHVVDCVMAGLARSGSVYEIKISDEILQLAVKNTIEELIRVVEVTDEQDNR